jgi:hypothetical protein
LCFCEKVSSLDLSTLRFSVHTARPRPRADLDRAGRRIGGQNKRLEINDDPFTDAILHYLGDREGKITSEDVWTILGVTDAGRRTADQQKRMGMALKTCGWQQSVLRFDGQRSRGYVKGKQLQGGGRRQVVVSRVGNKPIVEYEDERDPLED